MGNTVDSPLRVTARRNVFADAKEFSKFYQLYVENDARLRRGRIHFRAWLLEVSGDGGVLVSTTDQELKNVKRERSLPDASTFGPHARSDTLWGDAKLLAFKLGEEVAKEAKHFNERHGGLEGVFSRHWLVGLDADQRQSLKAFDRYVFQARDPYRKQRKRDVPPIEVTGVSANPPSDAMSFEEFLTECDAALASENLASGSFTKLWIGLGLVFILPFVLFRKTSDMGSANPQIVPVAKRALDYLDIRIGEVQNIFKNLPQENMRAASEGQTGLEVYEQSKGELTTLHLLGNRGKLQRLTLTIKLSADPETNADQLAIGRKLLERYDLGEWFTDATAAGQWLTDRVTMNTAKGDTIELKLEGAKHGSRIVEVMIATEATGIKTDVLVANIRDQVNARLQVLKVKLERERVFAPIASVTVSAVNTDDPIGVLKITVPRDSWTGLPMPRKLSLINSLKSAWAELNPEQPKTRLGLEVVDENGSVVGGTREQGKVFAIE